MIKVAMIAVIVACLAGAVGYTLAKSGNECLCDCQKCSCEVCKCCDHKIQK